jgi:flavin-dependent dehydrogenase
VAKVALRRAWSRRRDEKVDMPIEGGFVGMVDREHFDEWLRERARSAWRRAP